MFNSLLGWFNPQDHVACISLWSLVSLFHVLFFYISCRAEKLSNAGVSVNMFTFAHQEESQCLLYFYLHLDVLGRDHTSDR